MNDQARQRWGEVFCSGNIGSHFPGKTRGVLMRLRLGSQLLQALYRGYGCGGIPHSRICHAWSPLSLQDEFIVASKFGEPFT